MSDCIIGSLESELRISGTLETECLEVTSTISGWIKIVDILPQLSSDAVVDKVYQDAPQNTILEEVVSSTRSITVSIQSSYPLVSIGGVESVLAQSQDMSHYEGTVDITLPTQSSNVYALVAEVVTPENERGPIDTVNITVDYPPDVLDIHFVGTYPGSQTELKAGDTFRISGTLSKQSNQIQIQDYGAFQGSLVSIPLGTTFEITGTVADRGSTPQDLVARIRAKDPDTSAFGPTSDTTNRVTLNNTLPTINFGSIQYPANQQALKNNESAVIPVSMTHQDSFTYDSPNAELNFTSSSVSSASVSRIGGTYNTTSANFRASAKRNSNGATTTKTIVVKIANVGASLTVSTPAARLRSGGNGGTVAQDYPISITSNQELIEAPSIQPVTNAGSFTSGDWNGGPSVWTRFLRVRDDDLKGSFSWQSPTCRNLAGIVSSVISSGQTYRLGGFVLRSVEFDPFSTESSLGTKVSDYSKLVAGMFSSTQQASVNKPIGTSPPVENGWTLRSAAEDPSYVVWLDSDEASENSNGTALLLNIEEII